MLLAERLVAVAGHRYTFRVEMSDHKHFSDPASARTIRRIRKVERPVEVESSVAPVDEEATVEVHMVTVKKVVDLAKAAVSWAVETEGDR